MPGLGWADYELYKDDENTLVVQFTAMGAGFLNSGSWFGQSVEFLGDDTDSWSELAAELGMAWEFTRGNSTLFAGLSGVYTKTLGDDASGLTIGLDDSEQVGTEQAHFGWRLDDPFKVLVDDRFSLSAGRQDYSIGTGLLIIDGHSDGGERGGWYLGVRQAFQETVIASLSSRSLLAEGFFIKNTPRRGGVQGDASGVNLEYTVAEALSIGATWMVVDARLKDSDDMNTWSLRLGWSAAGGLQLDGEYVLEDSNQIDAEGWYGQVAWQFAASAWSPWVSYRYATFSGDNPATAADEQFREIAYGYSDYGSWYQGEITGNYILGNGNLSSHQLRLKAAPNDKLTLNLLYYDFRLDQPASLGPGVSSGDWGDEINLAADWAIDDHWHLVGVTAALLPGDAARQWVGDDEDWLYSMLFLTYTY